MNCKNCSQKLANDAKFCNNCGKPIEAEKPNIDIEKLKKSLRNTGSIVYAIGWMNIVINTGLYLWSILDKNFEEFDIPAPDLSGAFLNIVAACIFIILGKRIQRLSDKNIKLYLKIILVLFLLLFVFVLLSGGKIGILFFFVIAYLLSSFFQLRKAMKFEEFTATLTSPSYKLNKYGWIIFSVVTVIIFFITVQIDLSKEDFSTEKTAQQNISNYFTDTTWKKFDSTLGFSVLVPKYPTLESQNIPIPNSDLLMQLDTYTSETSDGTTYFITISTPLGVSSDKPLTNFDGPLNGMIASDPKNKLVSSTKTIFNGMDALDFLIKNEDSDFFLKGKLILNGTIMYTLMLVYENKNYNENDYNKFINSFILQ